MDVCYLFLLTKPRAQGVRADEILQEPSKDHGIPFRRLEQQRQFKLSADSQNRILLKFRERVGKGQSGSMKGTGKDTHVLYCLLKKKPATHKDS